MELQDRAPVWIGSQPDDIEPFLKSLQTDVLRPDDFRLAICPCGSVDFKVELDAHEGVARRTCVKCKHSRFVADSENYWDKAQPQPWRCVECGWERANLGTALARDEASFDPEWLFVGARCTRCGVLACVSDWQLDMEPFPMDYSQL